MFTDPFGLCPKPPCFRVEGSEGFRRDWQSLVDASSRLAALVNEASASDKPEFVLRATDVSSLGTHGTPGGHTDFYNQQGKLVEPGPGVQLGRIDAQVSLTDLANPQTREVIRSLGGVPTVGNAMVHEFAHGILGVQGYKSTDAQVRKVECAVMKEVPGGRC